uniref:Major royal jelly protein n=1 Tax=Lutzomyia longipalpis TaxID=7200 RepID=A0A1B0CBG8_LUTLO
MKKPKKLKGLLITLRIVHERREAIIVSESDEPTRPDEEFPVKETGNFVSVHHPVVDDVCNRVWFVDTGVLNYQEEKIEIQIPSLWIIDLPRVKCGKGPYNIHRHFKIPKSVVADGSGLRTVALDYTNTGACNDVFAYFPNSFTGEINVYDYKNNKAWSFHDHYSFFPMWKKFIHGTM